MMCLQSTCWLNHHGCLVHTVIVSLSFPTQLWNSSHTHIYAFKYILLKFQVRAQEAKLDTGFVFTQRMQQLKREWTDWPSFFFRLTSLFYVSNPSSLHLYTHGVRMLMLMYSFALVCLFMAGGREMSGVEGEPEYERLCRVGICFLLCRSSWAILVWTEIWFILECSMLLMYSRNLNINIHKAFVTFKFSLDVRLSIQCQISKSNYGFQLITTDSWCLITFRRYI